MMKPESSPNNTIWAGLRSLCTFASDSASEEDGRSPRQRGEHSFASSSADGEVRLSAAESRINPDFARQNRWSERGRPSQKDLSCGAISAASSKTDPPGTLRRTEDANPSSRQNLFTRSSSGKWGGCFGSTKLSELDLLLEREKAKRPSRAISKWYYITAYIVNDIMNGTFVLLPFVMSYNGWLGGIMLIWFIAGLNYYVAGLVWRMSQIFPGAVTMGDLSYYLLRSPLAMFVVFVLGYGLIFTTTGQQLSMAALTFQYSIFGDYNYQICKPVWLALVGVALIPLAQIRVLGSSTIFVINMVNIAFLMGFWLISIGTAVYDAVVNHHEVPSKLFAHASDLVMWTNTDLDGALNVGFPLLGITIVIGMFYYNIILLEIIAETKDPKRLFPKANKVATLFVLVIYTLTAIIFYATFEEEYLDLYSFRKGVILFLTPLEDTWVGKMGAFMFGLCLTGSSLVRVLVLTRALHLFVHAKNANSTSVWSAVEWFALSFLIIGLATLLAIAVPDVHILSSVNGALALLVCFILPSCFFLLALRLASGWRLKVLTIEKVGLWIIVILGVIALIMYVIIMTYQYEDIAERVVQHKIESPTWQIPQCTAMIQHGIYRNTTTMFLDNSTAAGD